MHISDSFKIQVPEKAYFMWLSGTQDSSKGVYFTEDTADL